MYCLFRLVYGDGATLVWIRGSDASRRRRQTPESSAVDPTSEYQRSHQTKQHNPPPKKKHNKQNIKAHAKHLSSSSSIGSIAPHFSNAPLGSRPCPQEDTIKRNKRPIHAEAYGACLQNHSRKLQRSGGTQLGWVFRLVFVPYNSNCHLRRYS